MLTGKELNIAEAESRRVCTKSGGTTSCKAILE